MDIICRCQCGAQFKVDAKYAGKKAKCPKCQQVTLVPTDISAPPSSSASGIAPTDPKKARFQDAAATQANITQPDFADISAPKVSQPLTAPKPTPAPIPTQRPAAIPVANTVPTPGKMSVTERMRTGNTANLSGSAIDLSVEPTSAAEKLRARHAKKKPVPMIAYIIGGGLTLLLLVVSGIGAAAYIFSGKSKPTLLVLNWSETDRLGRPKLELDSKNVAIPKSGPIEIPLTPGTHRLRLQRVGYEAIEYGFSVKQGERFPFAPAWKELALASNTTGKNAGSTSTPKFPGIGSAVDPNEEVPGVPNPGVFPNQNPNPILNSNPNANPNQNPGTTNSGDDGPVPTGFAGNGWMQLIDQAKRHAASKRKDIFMVFTGSDWARPSVEMTNKLFSHPKFIEFVKDRFALLVIDEPQTQPGFNLLVDAAQNQQLRKEYGVERVPSVFLLDANGNPYAVHGFFDKDVDEYLKFLNEQLIQRSLRDELFQKAMTEPDMAMRLRLAEAALSFVLNQKAPKANARPQEMPLNRYMREQSMFGAANFYASHISQWSRLAQQMDKDNAEGKAELFFEVDWVTRLHVNEDQKILAELKQWPHDRFKDQDRGMRLYLRALRVSGKLPNTRQEDVESTLSELAKFKPQAAELRQASTELVAALKQKDQLGSGTGFIVDSSGYLLTNFHVIDGPGKVVVRIPGSDEQIPAQVVAKDSERDIAILKVDPAQLPGVRVVKIVDTPLNRGARVAVFGYPLGDDIGGGVKLTTGVISALPDQATENMVLIDNKVNPGNSGGPLCNAQGYVIGMVTAKSHSGNGLDSYGMAIPAKDLEAYLSKHLPTFIPTPPPKSVKNLEWDAVDPLISPGVLMILKVR